MGAADQAFVPVVLSLCDEGASGSITLVPGPLVEEICSWRSPNPGVVNAVCKGRHLRRKGWAKKSRLHVTE